MDASSSPEMLLSASADSSSASFATASTPSGSDGGSEVRRKSAGTMKCSLCRNHGVLTPYANHKRVCPFRCCACSKCRLTEDRRCANLLIRSMRSDATSPIKETGRRKLSEKSVSTRASKLERARRHLAQCERVNNVPKKALLLVPQPPPDPESPRPMSTAGSSPAEAVSSHRSPLVDPVTAAISSPDPPMPTDASVAQPWLWHSLDVEGSLDWTSNPIEPLGGLQNQFDSLHTAGDPSPSFSQFTSLPMSMGQTSDCSVALECLYYETLCKLPKDDPRRIAENQRLAMAIMDMANWDMEQAVEMVGEVLRQTEQQPVMELSHFSPLPQPVLSTTPKSSVSTTSGQ